MHLTKRFVFFLFILIFSVLLPHPLLAQSSQQGRIGGVIFIDVDRDGKKDAEEGILANITVTLSGPHISSQSTTSSPLGIYQFNRLSVGEYEITVDLNDENLPKDYTPTTVIPISVSMPTEKTKEVDIGLAASTLISLNIDAYPHIVYESEVVNFSYTILNKSDATSIKDLTLHSNEFEWLLTSNTKISVNPNSLYQHSHTAQLGGDGLFTETAWITVTDTAGLLHKTSDSFVVDVIKRPDSDTLGVLNLDVTTHHSTVLAGETIVYSYTVTNLTSDDVIGIVVEDKDLGLISGIDRTPSFALAPLGRRVLTAATVLYADRTTVAQVSGINELDDLVTDTDQLDVIVTGQRFIYLPLIVR